MTNTTKSPRERNLERMAAQRRRAAALGFTDAGEVEGSLRHTSGRFELSVLDDECAWRLSLRVRFTSQFGSYWAETGSVELSNLTPAQFGAVLSGLLLNEGS